jgi:hypothetical protein
MVYQRVKSGCPYCSGRFAIKGENDLRTLNPKLARELVDDDATTLKVNSHLKVKWKCKLGHIWEAKVSDRSKGHGCSICSGKTVLIGFNDLRTTHPHLAREADGWDPKSTTAGSGVMRKWICKKGHTWNTKTVNRTHTRTGKDSGCPTCSGHKILPGFNDLRTVAPLLAKEAVGWDPSQIGPWHKENLTWKCKKGHTYDSLVEYRRRGDGCPYCSGRKCLTGFNDIKTTDPKLAKQAFGWDPTLVTRGSGKRVKWKCEKGHTWLATPNTRTTSKNNGSGCPGCEVTGFNPEKSAHLYLLKHSKWKMFQVGITNSPNSRLAKHRQLGWSQVEVIGPMPGKKAKKLERDVLNYLKLQKVTFANKAGGQKFDGWTESWTTASFQVRSLKQLLTLISSVK